MAEINKASELLRGDLRMHPGQSFRFDLCSMIANISTAVQDCDYYDISFPDGYYLPTDKEEPTIKPDVTYYCKVKNTLVPITNIAAAKGNIYDRNWNIVVNAKMVPWLRPYPKDNPKISAMVINFIYSEIECVQERGMVGLQSIEDLVFPFILKEEYDYRSDYFEYTTEMENVLYNTIDLLESEYDLHLFCRRLGKQNPKMVFNVTLDNGILTITAEDDWRVLEYERMMREIEMRKLLEEQDK